MVFMASYFLTHATRESRLSTRSFYESVALNLAEGGIDIAMLDINNSAIGTTNGWRAATDNAASWVKTISGAGNASYAFGQGTGNTYIRVDNWTAGTLATVTVTSVGQVAVPNQAALNKQLVVKVARRSGAAAGMIVKGSILFNGNVKIDSYNSTLGAWNATTNRSDLVNVATDSTAANSYSGGNGQVYGYVATGHSAPSVGSSGRIYGATTAAGVKIDPARVRQDFSQNIPNATGPSGTPINLGAISGNLTLPRAGDTLQANGRYLYTDNNGGLQLNGNNVLTINGPVDIVLNANMQMGGNAKIQVNNGASINVYGYQGLQVDGNGVANASGDPKNVAFYSLGTSDVQLNGNADFTGIIYAPNSALQSNGNGNISGSITVSSVQFNGNASFHYDVNLGSSAPSPYYAVKSWNELTDASTLTSNFKHDTRDPFTFLN